MSEFVMVETALPSRRRLGPGVSRLIEIVARLALPNRIFAREWFALASFKGQHWFRLWALTDDERLRLRCILDAFIAEVYGLQLDEFAWILRDCDHPVSAMRSDDFTRSLDPKGFWRVDKDKDPELRHTVLTLVAFHELKRLGLDAFLALNDGEGWMLPETLRLADYGLGHDDRAKEAQPVAPRLGPRFLPWQLEQGVEESWEECARHAERLEALLGRAPATGGGQEDRPPPEGEKPTDLFGNVDTPTRSRRSRRGPRPAGQKQST